MIIATNVLDMVTIIITMKNWMITSVPVTIVPTMIVIGKMDIGEMIYRKKVAEMNECLDYECLDCDCYDEDFGCTMPSIDRCYACPLFADEDELKEMLEKEGKE